MGMPTTAVLECYANVQPSSPHPEPNHTMHSILAPQALAALPHSGKLQGKQYNLWLQQRLSPYDHLSQQSSL